ncbi:MAG: chemotaxis protein CheB [Pseudomonas sp.]|nr:MAG: chemotaxis protein CheB [Pseudomonas sp.]
MALPFSPLIVFAASQGGMDALCRIVCHFPADFPATIAIVLHTHESSPRYLAKILAEHTSLAVAYAVDGDELVTGQIFVAPPGAHLVIQPNHCFGLDQGPKVNYTRPAADCLFTTAAQVMGHQVIGVVLTGGDGDGSQGLKKIKEHGGRSVVQSPADSRAPSMPITAIVHDSPDHIAMLDEMGPLLKALVEADAAGQGRLATV